MNTLARRPKSSFQLFGKIPISRRNGLLSMAAVIVVGVLVIYYTRAATTGPVATQSATGTLAGNAQLVSNSAEVGGQLVRFGGSSTPTNTPTPTPSSGGAGLSVNGVSLVSNGTRFIFKGVNLEYFRDSGNASISNSEVPIAAQIVAKMKATGINAVRLDYSPAFVNQGSNMTNYLAMMKLLATNGIYVMPCDHSYTGKDISGYTTTSFPDFKTIINYAAQQGITNYLIMNPYNEPYSSDNASSWNTANEATLQYFRSTLGFKGVVVLDTTAWATTDNTSSFQTLMSYDATLLGGKSNVIFSNHWYPNYGYQTSMTLARQYPLVIGELGNTLNGSYSSSGASYVNTVFQAVISTAIPNGHNGVFPWIWWWSDGNQMTNDGLNLNSFGQSIVTNYYSKVTN
ncbi:MAG TPA: cellulase family glycosylhydrolase [Candidatus Saccharimonadia bacterium]